VIRNVGFFSKVVQLLRSHRGMGVNVCPTVELLPILFNDMFLEGLIEQCSRIRGRYCELNGKRVELLCIGDGPPNSLHGVIGESQNVIRDYPDAESMAEVDDRLLLFLAGSFSKVLQ